MSFWERLARITAAEWGRDYVIYLYRESPKVRIAGQGGYLCKLAQPFSPDDIKARYGGGTFKAMLNRGQDLIDTETFEVEGLPIFDITRENPNGASGVPAVTSSTAENKLLTMLQEQIGRLNDELSAMRAKGEQPNPAMERGLDILTTAYKRGIETQVGQAPDSLKSLELAFSLLEKIRPPASNPMMDKLIGAVAEKMLVPVDPMAQITTFLTIFEKLDALRGEGRPGKRDWKELALEKGAELLPRVLDEFHANRDASVEVARTRLQTAQTMRGVATPPGAPPMPAAVAVPPSAPGRAGLQVERLNGEPIPAQAEEAAAAPVVPMIDPNSEAYQNFVKARVVDMIDQNYEAADIVAYLDGALPGFCNQLTYPEAVVEAWMRGDPILVRAVNHPRWKKLFPEVRSYITENAEEEIAPPPAPKPN